MTKLLLAAAALSFSLGAFAQDTKPAKPAPPAPAPKAGAPGANRPPAPLPTMPVRFGGDVKTSGCPGNGVVLTTTTLATVSAAGKLELGTIPVNAKVTVCDILGDDAEAYLGVIYADKNQQCGLTPNKERVAYKGPCKSGWIRKSFFALTPP